MSNTKRLFAAFVAIVIVALLSYIIKLSYEGLVREQSNDIGRRVVNSLQVGMSRDQVAPLVENAWRHYDCGYMDVYLFGSRDPRLASIVILRFENNDGTRVLTKISGFENEFLHEFDTCRVTER